jgi:hypothetical protein
MTAEAKPLAFLSGVVRIRSTSAPLVREIHHRLSIGPQDYIVRAAAGRDPGAWFLTEYFSVPAVNSRILRK